MLPNGYVDSRELDAVSSLSILANPLTVTKLTDTLAMSILRPVAPTTGAPIVLAEDSRTTTPPKSFKRYARRNRARRAGYPPQEFQNPSHHLLEYGIIPTSSAISTSSLLAPIPTASRKRRNYDSSPEVTPTSSTPAEEQAVTIEPAAKKRRHEDQQVAESNSSAPAPVFEGSGLRQLCVLWRIASRVFFWFDFGVQLLVSWLMEEYNVECYSKTRCWSLHNCI